MSILLFFGTVIALTISGIFTRFYIEEMGEAYAFRAELFNTCFMIVMLFTAFTTLYYEGEPEALNPLRMYQIEYLTLKEKNLVLNFCQTFAEMTNDR